MNDWLALILTLPTGNATARMRVWRTLKASGAAVLRDGVYLLPRRDECLGALSAVAEDVRQNEGTAYLLEVSGSDTEGFPGLFDRSLEYTALLAEISHLRAGLTLASADESVKKARRLRKQVDALTTIDFFPGEGKQQVLAAQAELDQLLRQLRHPGEPQAIEMALPRLEIADFQGRRWATRKRPWADRLASAWLIQRFIDPAAHFLWLATPADCPSDALGFDFDGARFSHTGSRVTFETLCASFGLDSPAMRRMAALVHYLDVGGTSVPEAAGVEQVLTGLRSRLSDDNLLLTASFAIFDGLLAAFESEQA
ncbi:chromate resistance protein [Chitinimonas viridis]|uniref:Chromate resistance protein n=1 Tax=Chitinimonas viridis TaxID=664880 RepID=A0ABT8B2P2_9NEIS|nr:chromate resistance protein ChrB domain-containing protein [Chitinimonas viridis]MDN3575818.1 chromate resistance protein [Chitinimonas viridis]